MEKSKETERASDAAEQRVYRVGNDRKGGNEQQEGMAFSSWVA
jgi:hypothetical protein